MSGLAGEEGFKDKVSGMVPAGHQCADSAHPTQHDLGSWPSLFTILGDLSDFNKLCKCFR